MFVVFLDLAVAVLDLNVLGLDTTELFSVAVGEVVHCLLSNIETIPSMINSEYVDGFPIVRHTIAGATLQGVRIRAKRAGGVGSLEGSSTPQFLDIHQCKDTLGSGPEFAWGN